MKTLITVFLLTSTLLVNAKELGEKEIKTLKNEIHEILTLFSKGDGSGIISKTHSSMIKVMGSKENFENTMKQALKELKQTGIKFESLKIGVPTKLYDAGEEEVTFVPKVSIIAMKGKRVRSENFMIAIRTKGKKEWTYLDGAGLSKNKKLLWTFLPKLSKEVVLPPITVKLL